MPRVVVTLLLAVALVGCDRDSRCAYLEVQLAGKEARLKVLQQSTPQDGIDIANTVERIAELKHLGKDCPQ